MLQANKFLNKCWIKCMESSGRSFIEYLSVIPGEKPGWYIWPKQGSGVFEIQMAYSNTKEESEESNFILRFYPHPDHYLFDKFSFAEQVVRLSPFFDDSTIEPRCSGGCACSVAFSGHSHSPRIKGIPRYHARRELHPSMYTVGEILFVLERGRLIEMVFSSQDMFHQYSVSGIFVEDKGQVIEVISPGELDRQVPGWDISKEFLKLFSEGILTSLGLCPHSVKETTNPGYVYFREEGGRSWEVEDDSVTRITQSYFFRGC